MRHGSGKQTRELDAMIEDHNSGNDPLRRNASKNEEPPDAVEIWGRRVGRALGVLFAIFLVWQLVVNYIIKPA